MPRVRSGDAEIVYEVLGDGPPVLLLHPFPAHRGLWMPAAQSLVSRYRVILPDLRGHGDSGVGEAPATMEKHAADLGRVLDHAEAGRVAIAGVSIGGYVFFEFWRRFRGRVAAVVLCDTKAQADTPEARAARLQAAADVMQRGTEPFVESMVPKLLGKTTLNTRPDLVKGARQIMLKSSREGISQVQKGMAERPDSVNTLKTINVPALVVVGDEDSLSTVADAELMRQNIGGCVLKVIPRAGHYAVWEQHEAVGNVVRQFLDAAQLSG
ncbi:MAG TPA: alpha/beta hydrolase [Terriglobales bacterium]|nr:alpha/beta hydrolase [Terriglobales bacterium]